MKVKKISDYTFYAHLNIFLMVLYTSIHQSASNMALVHDIKSGLHWNSTFYLHEWYIYLILYD